MSVGGGSVFSQLLSLIDRSKFAGHVKMLKVEKHSKGLKCWDQFVAMLFCQVGQCKSLREISQGLRSCEGKLQLLGLEEAPKRSTLSYANAHRNWQLYERVFYDLLGRCQQLAPKKKLRFKNRLLSLDSTVIDLCASVFDWARFRKTKGAVKLHLLLDHDGCLPTFTVLSEGNVHDVKVAQHLRLPAGSIVAMDRGYYDFELFSRWTREKVWFVSRLKSNADYYVLKENPVPRGGAILADEVICFAGATAEEKCPQRMRRVVVWVEEKAYTIELITNHHGLAASTISAVYKERWQIELFFKAIKQKLRIKTFVGTSANALHIQVWTALISILLMKYLQFRSQLKWALSNLVALVRLNLFTYRDLWAWIDDPFNTPPRGSPLIQPLLPGL